MISVACDLVIPCRDEAAALGPVLARVPERFRPLVVDNGSTDGTADVARSLGATVVVEDRPGYGAAVHAGVTAASAPYVAVMDGDGSLDAADLDPLLDDVVEQRATMATGRRRPNGRGVWPWHARAGTSLLAWWIARSSGLGVHDLAPMRVCGRQALLDLDLRDRRFGYPLELFLAASRAGWTISEHDVSYGRRAAGTRSKVSGSVRGTALTVADFARVMR